MVSTFLSHIFGFSDTSSMSDPQSLSYRKQLHTIPRSSAPLMYIQHFEIAVRSLILLQGCLNSSAGSLSDSRENFHSKTKSHIDEVLFSFRGVWLDYVIHHGISIREGGRTAEGLKGNSGAAPCSNCPRAGMFCALMCPTGG